MRLIFLVLAIVVSSLAFSNQATLVKLNALEKKGTLNNEQPFKVVAKLDEQGLIKVLSVSVNGEDLRVPSMQVRKLASPKLELIEIFEEFSPPCEYKDKQELPLYFPCGGGYLLVHLPFGPLRESKNNSEDDNYDSGFDEFVITYDLEKNAIDFQIVVFE